jgi:arylsulfatase A-like enzyme
MTLYQYLPLGILIQALFGCYPEISQNPPRPNIILIMGDDMGYSDIGLMGSEIRTPNLDRLGANGLLFTNFYNTARCCPTRASLLTGLYPQQAGIGHMMDDRGTVAYRGDLSQRAVTIAEVLKQAGYSTFMSGKWHVTPFTADQVDDPKKHNWPLQRGFDQFFGMIHGAGSFYDPPSLTEGNQYIAPEKGFYFTNAITDYAVQRIREHDSDSPFFMYVAYTAAHWPMHALPQDIAKYKGHYDRGWDKVRSERLTRMMELGLVRNNWQLTERDPNVPSWSDSIADRAWEIANMEVYAAMVDNMDQGIGKIIQELKSNELFENTLILFLQDNGACAEDLGWEADRQTPQEQPPRALGWLQTQMIPNVTREGKPVKLMREVMPGPPESYTAYGLAWANASNTPFREYKHWVHEGGIATPLIVHWPAGIKETGGHRSQPSHLIDVMATCVDVAGATYPSTYNDQSIISLEGSSLVPVFANQTLNREAIYWEHEGNRAVRMGKWKLVSKADEDSFIWDEFDELPTDKWELFDMEIDRTETNDLARDNPEIVDKMAGKWLEWARRTKTVPRPKRR